MVIVVPAFAERKHTHKDVIPTLVTTSVRLGTPDVTDRVHAPGDVMDDHDPHQTAPDEPKEGTDPETLAE